MLVAIIALSWAARQRNVNAHFEPLDNQRRKHCA